MSGRCGAVGGAGDGVCWRVWAPQTRRVDLVLIGDDGRRTEVPMAAADEGHFERSLPNVPDGQRYSFRLDGGPDRPDPCSLWQPAGVHGPSAVVRPRRFGWTDQGWAGVPLVDLVLYELHVGTFTPEGTFDAVIPRLPELRELGVTAVELMPVAQTPGRGWGYDGVGLFAAHSGYGGPHGLHRLVDACHREGLAVVLDVVYNHFGPEGCYLREFGPYFTDAYKTPWGAAVNFDGPGSDGVRAFVLANARVWLEEFRVDGLRLDAVHAVYDLGARHILADLQEAADAVAARRGFPAHVIAESDQNDPRLLLPPERGGHGLTGQWADDFHHAVHTALTGERDGYYADFGTPEQVAAALGEPYLYAGRYSRCRGRRHGAPPPPELTGERFVACLQNHDQVGNRARGERLSTLVKTPAELRLAASLLLLSPYTPLLFMGEEYGETAPFPFFCGFDDPGLVEAVRAGRRREFAAFEWAGELPDPFADATAESARLSWDWTDPARAGLRRLYRDLLATRRAWPALRDRTRRPGRLLPGDVVELVRGDRQVVFNLAAEPRPLAAAGECVFSSEWGCYGGCRPAGGPVRELLPHECVVVGPTG